MTPLQVCQIRMCLRRLLPEELVNPILNHAQVYTASNTTRKDKLVFDDRHGSVWNIENRNEREGHWLYLATFPIYGRLPPYPHPSEEEDREIHAEDDQTSQAAVGDSTPAEEEEEAEEVPEDPSARNPWKVKAIKVTTWSRDQGWTSEHHDTEGEQRNSEWYSQCADTLSRSDPYDGSYTWFEIGIGRRGEIMPWTMEIQKNRRGKRNRRTLMNCRSMHNHWQRIAISNDMSMTCLWTSLSCAICVKATACCYWPRLAILWVKERVSLGAAVANMHLP